MSEFQGKLSKRLNLPVPPSKKLVEQLQGQKGTLYGKMMPGQLRGRLIGEIDGAIYELKAKPKGDAKTQVKTKAFNLGKDIARAVNNWDKISGKAIARIERIKSDGEEKIIDPLTKKFKELKLDISAVPEVEEFNDAYNRTSLAVGSIGTSAKGPNGPPPTEEETVKALNLIADNFENKINEISPKAPKNWLDQAIRKANGVKELIVCTEQIKTVRISAAGTLDKLDIVTGDPKVSLPFRKQLNDLPKPPYDDTTGPETLEKADKLAQGLETHLQKLTLANEKELAKRQKLLDSCEQTLKGLIGKVISAQLDMGGGAYANELSRLCGLAEAKLDTAKMCLQQKIAGPSGLDVLDETIKECQTILDEGKSLTPKQADQLFDNEEKAKELSKRSKWVFFDSDLQTYAPRTAALLKTQISKLEEETAGMSFADREKRFNEVLAAAEQAKKETAELKTLCTVTAKQKLDQARKDLTLLDKQVKPGPFYGALAEAVQDLEAALDFGAGGPDKSTIEAAMKTIADQTATLLPGGKPITALITDSHQKGLETKQERDGLKTEVEKAKLALSNVLKQVEKATNEADPGDKNAYADLKRERDDVDDRAKTALKALGEGLGDRNLVGSVAELKTLIEDYKKLQARADRLKDEPGGRVALSPKQLTESGQIFSTALSTTVTEVGALATAAKTLLTLPSQTADVTKLETLVANTLKQLQLPEQDIKSAVATLAQKSTQQTMPARLKAREDGLAAVRRYRDVCRGNPALVKLKAETAFDNDGFSRLEFAIDNLDLNFNRGI